MSYHPTLPHYRRAHAPNRLYLPPGLNATIMYHDYAESDPEPCGLRVYQQEVHDMGISFARTG